MQHDHHFPIMSRRFFLAAASASVAWPFAALGAAEAPDRRVATADYPFKLGVASGDPEPDGVVLWTRLAPDPAKRRRDAAGRRVGSVAGSRR